MNRLLKSFFGLTLGVAFSLGVAASLNANRITEAAKADGTSTTLYYAVNTDEEVRININYKGDDFWWDQKIMTPTEKTYQNKTIYSVTFTDHYSGLGCLQFQINGGSTSSIQIFGKKSWHSVDTYNGKMCDGTTTLIDYEYDKSYQIKCGSGNYIPMSWDDGGSLPSGVKGQFSATLNISAGDSLSFKADGSAFSPSFSGDTNNYHDGAVCVSVNSAKIYLKYKTDNSYDVWVPGYTACTVVVGGIEYATVQSSEGGSVVYDTAVVYVDKTQNVQVSWYHNTEATYLNGDSVSGCFVGSDGTVTCSLTGAYNIRVHNNGYGKHNTLYITRNDNSTATYLAQKFNSLVGGTCHSDGSTNTGTLKTAWDNAAGHFTGQPTGITNKFVKNSSDSDIRIMMGTTGVDGKYQYVIHKYGTGVASDFLRTGDTKQAHSFMPLTMIGNDNSILIIVAISALGILSIGAYYFFKKSKKAEE